MVGVTVVAVIQALFEARISRVEFGKRESKTARVKLE